MPFDPSTAVPATEPTASKFDPSTAQPERGTLAEIGTGALRGLYTGVRGIGSIMQAPAEQAREEPGIVSRAGKAMEEFGKAGADRNAAQLSHGGVTNFASEAASSIGSAAPVIAANIGGNVVGALAGPAGAEAGGIGAASGAAGLQTWHEKYQEALHAGLPDEEARTYAHKSASVSAAGMAALAAIPGGVGIIGKAVGGAAKTAAEAGADVVGKKFMPEMAKQAAGIVGGNTALGMGQAAGQAAIDQSSLPGDKKGPSPWEAAKAAAMPSLAGSVGFLPLGALHAQHTASESAKFKSALEDGDAHPLARARAANAVYEAMKKADPDAADAWKTNALEALKRKAPIGLTDDWTKPNPELFPEMKLLPSPQAIAMGEGAAAQQSDPSVDQRAKDMYAARDEEEARRSLAMQKATESTPPEAPAPADQLLLPAPKPEDMGTTRNNVPIQLGGPDAETAGPFSVTKAHAEQNTADIAREAHAQQIEQAGNGGTLSTAAAQSVRSGHSEEAQGARTEAPAEKAAAKPEEENGPVGQWAKQQRPQSLPEAQATADQMDAAANGQRTYAVAAHPDGGYMVLPTEHAPAGSEGLRRTQDVPEKEKQFPMDQGAAEAHAQKLTNTYGVEHEAVPSPVAREKFVVQKKAAPDVQSEPTFTEHEQPTGAKNDVQEPTAGEAGSERGAVQGAEAARPDEEITLHPVSEDHAAGVQQDRGLNLVSDLTSPERAKATNDVMESAGSRSRAMPLSPEHQEQVAQALQTLGARANVDRLGDVTSINLHNKDAPLSFNTVTRSLGINADHLAEMLSAGESGRHALSEHLDHELWHAADTASGEGFASARSPLFEVTGDGAERKAVGPVIKEALDHVQNGGTFADILKYPMENFNDAVGAGGIGKKSFAMNDVISAEAFAQLGRIYNSAPEFMAHELPNAYKLFKAIHDTAKRENTSVSEATRRELQPVGRSSERVHGERDVDLPKDGAVAERTRSGEQGKKPDEVAPRNAAKLDDFKPGNVAKLLKKKDWTILTAENPNARTLPDALNAARNAKLERDMKKMGVSFEKVIGKYGGNDEHSFVVTGITREQSEMLRDKYGQESVLTRDGLLHNDGSVTPATGLTEHQSAPEDFFTRVPSTGAHFSVDLNFDARSRPTRVPADVAKHLTADEIAELGKSHAKHQADRVENLAKVMESLPSTKEYVHAALAGKAARGWYERSRKAGEAMYGKDYPRFAALMAALSPQSDVETNFYNAAKVWSQWHGEGRPTDAQSVAKILKDNIVTPEGAKAGREAMDAYLFNSIRALRHETGDVKLSGPKVESFRNNLIGNLNEVTNDRHIAAFSGIMRELLGGLYNERDSVNKVANKGYGYMAANVRQREAAKALSKATGEVWHPAEVQETVWSFWKALYELATQKGQTKSALQLIRDGDLKHDMIGQVPDLGRYFDEAKFKSITRGKAQGTEGNPEEAARLSAAFRSAPREAGPVARNATIERIAKRLDALIADRAEAERVNRAKEDEGRGDAYERDLPDEDALGNIPGFDEPAKADVGDSDLDLRFSRDGEPRSTEPPATGPISHSKDMPEWVRGLPPEGREALRKAGVWVQKKSLRERWKQYKHDAALKVLQGTVDQFRPVLEKIGEYPYKLLRMASASSGALDESLKSGHIEVNDYGALQIKKGTKGLLETLKPLGEEVDRFLAWVAGNRAERLFSEGKEHNFTKDQFEFLKTLNGKTHDGDIWKGEGTRASTYMKTLKEWNAYSKSILDIAEKSGLIDSDGRKMWEHDFYVPFYREAERSGPEGGNISGMVNKQAFKKLKGGQEELKDLLANSLGNWAHLLDASLRNNAAWQTLQHAEEKGIATQIKEAESVKGDVFVMQDGKKQYYHVNDPLVLDAISSLSATPFRGPVMKALSTFKKVLTHGVTLSPTFRIRNVIRDQVSALAVNDMSYNFVKNIIEGMKYSSKDNPEYAMMQAGGAFMHLAHNAENGYGEHVKRLIKEGVDKATILDEPSKVTRLFKDAYEWWESTGERSESLTRATVYRAAYANAIKAGHSPERAHFEAAYSARDAMDFGLRGTWPAIRMLTQVVPFMNARLQGLYKLGRGGAADPARFAAVLGGVTLATIGLSLANYGDKEIENLPDSDHNDNWIFRVGSKVYRIPKPFEVGALATIADRGLRVALDGFQPSDRELFMQRLGMIVGSQLNMNPIPQAVWPAIQLWANQDAFRGSAIETQRDQKLTTSQRIGPSTSATAQLLGKAEVLSPEQIDFLVNSYMGWVGTHAMMTADLAVRPMMGLPEKPTRRIDDYFMVGDFVHQLPSNQSRFVERFYTHLQQVQQAMGDMRLLQQTGQAQAAMQYAKSNKNVLEMARMYNQTSREISKLNQRQRYVQMRTEASGFTPEAKRAELDRLAQLKAKLTESAESYRARVINRPQ